MRVLRLYRWLILCSLFCIMGNVSVSAQVETDDHMYVSLPSGGEGVVERYVSITGGNEQNSGKTWNEARSNLQNVIEELRNMIATTADVKRGRIFVEGGTYKPTQSTGGVDQGLSHTAFKLYSGIEIYGGCTPAAQLGNGVNRRRMKIDASKAKGWEIDNPTILSGSHSSVQENFEWQPDINRYKTVFPSSSYHVVWFATGEVYREGELLKGFDKQKRALPLDPRKPAILDGVIIQGGNASEENTDQRYHNSYGGGVYMVGNSILRNSEVRRCRATRSGGGIYMDGGGLVDACYVHTNQCEGVGLLEGYGGGVSVADSGLVRQCLIADNMARCGGGLALLHNDGEVLREDPVDGQLKGLNRYFPSAAATIVTNNTASTDAGGLLLFHGGTVNHMTVANNHCSGSEIVIRRRRYGMSGGAFIEEAGVIFNSVIYGNEVRKLGDASVQYASYKENKDDKENRPYMHYCAVQNLEQTDWSGTTRRGVIGLSATPGKNNPLFIQECPFSGVQQMTETVGQQPIRKGTYEQLTDEQFGTDSRYNYYWKPKSESLLHSAGVNLSSFVTRSFMLFAIADKDFAGEKYSSRSTLGARVAVPYKYQAASGIESLENNQEAGVFTLFVDPSLGYEGSGEENQKWGLSWDYPFLYLADALEYVRQVRVAGFKSAEHGIDIPKNAIFQIFVKEGESTTASNHYSGDLHSASLGMVDGTRVYGGFPKQLTGTLISMNISDKVYQRNPLLYPSVLTADVLKLEKGRNSDHVVTFTNVSDAVLDGFFIEKGYAMLDIKNNQIGHKPVLPKGAGILICDKDGGKTMTGNKVRNCNIANCTAEEGAAVWAKATYNNIGAGNDGAVGVSFENCIFHNNTAHEQQGTNVNQLSFTEGTSTIFIDAAPGKTIHMTFNHCDIVKNKGTAFTTGAGDVWLKVSNTAIWANAKEEMATIDGLQDPMGFSWGGTVVDESGENPVNKIMFDHCMMDKGLTIEPGWTSCKNNLTYNSNDVDSEGLPTYPECINPTKNVGASYGMDQTLTGGPVDFTPRNMNPMVNAADAASMAGTDFTSVDRRNYGGAADIGALENTELMKDGRIIYVRDYKDPKIPGGNGSSWAEAINGNYDGSVTGRPLEPHPFKYVDSEIPVDQMTGLQWAVDEAFYRSLRKTKGDKKEIDYTTTFDYVEGSMNESAVGKTVTAHKAVVRPNHLVQVWVAAGTYTKANGFFMRDGVDVFGGFPSKGSPGMAERDPKDPELLTIIQTLTDEQAHSIYHFDVNNSPQYQESNLWGPNLGFQAYGNGGIDRYDLNYHYSIANTTQRVLTQPLPYYKGDKIQEGQKGSSIEFMNKPLNGFSRLTSWDGFVIQNGRVRISNSRDGGAGVALRYNGRIVNCVVRNNANVGYSMLRGGGIFCNDGEIVNCIVEGNVVDYVVNGRDGMGGGLYLRTGTVYNTCFTRNASLNKSNDNATTVGGISGAVHFENGQFYNNTITKNRGKGAVQTGNWFIYGYIDMYNTIIFDNPDCNENELIISSNSGGGGEVKTNVRYCLLPWRRHSGLVISPENGNVELDRNETPFDVNSLKLKPGSIAINAGTDDFSDSQSQEITLPDFDAEYKERIQDCRVDIGAYEYNGAKDISPNVYDETAADEDKNKIIFYVSQNGAGDMSGNIDNPACAQKLQKVLDAAGRERAKGNNNGKEIVVRLAGDEGATQNKQGDVERSGFVYCPSRTTLPDQVNENPRLWSIMVPHGITVEGGWTSEFNKEGRKRNIIKCPTILSGIYHMKENDVTVYHVVTFTDDVFDIEGKVITPGGLATQTATTILDGLHIEDGRADGEKAPDNSGGAAIVPGYAHVRNCILQNNSAAESGGALFLETKALVSGCLFMENSAKNGGAVSVKEGDTPVDYSKDLQAQVDLMAHIYTSTFVSNHALNEGGAIWFDDNVRVNSSVIWNNEASMNMNVSGQLNPLSTEHREATLVFYPLAYCAVENVRIPGLNNIRVNSKNSRGVRFLERDGQAPDTREIVPYYAPTSYSLLARSGMPAKDYNALVSEKNLAASDFADVLRGDKVDQNGAPYSNTFIEIGARAFNGRLTVVPDAKHLLTRLYVAQADVDWDLVILLEAIQDENEIYRIKGSSFAYPMIELEEALEYIRMVRKDATLQKDVNIRNTQFEIFVAGGTYFPIHDIEGQNVTGKFEESSRATFLVPEGVSIYGGLDNIERHRDGMGDFKIFYGQKQKSTSAPGDSIKDIDVIYGGQNVKIRLQQKATPEIMKARVRYDRNVNGIVEPWEMKYQTILSGNVVDKEENVHHVVTCIPYGSGLTPKGIKTIYDDTNGDITKGIRPDSVGGTLLFDGVEIIEGTALKSGNSQHLAEGTSPETFLEPYAERGGAILVAGNIGRKNPSSTTDKSYGWIGPKDEQLKRGAVGRRNIPLVVRNCRFNGNRAGEGGAIFTDGELKIYSSSFERNSSEKSVDFAGNGGAIAANYEMTAINTIFENNEAIGDGVASKSGVGAAMYSGENGWTHMLNCNMVRNQAKDYPALYFATPNTGKPAYDHVSQVEGQRDAFANGADRHMIVNTLFWGNEAPGGNDFVVNYATNTGKVVDQITEPVLPTEEAAQGYITHPASAPELPSEALWFCAYEQGRGLAPVRPKIKGVDMREAPFSLENGCHYLPQVFYEYITNPTNQGGLNMSMTALNEYQMKYLANYNVWLNTDNYDLNGPNFSHPSTEAGVKGYDVSASWMVTRTNNLTDNGWTTLVQTHPDTEDGELKYLQTEEVGGQFRYAGSGIYYDWYYEDNPDFLNFSLGMDDYMINTYQSDKKKRARLRVSLNPDLKEKKTYIDIGVYEFRHIKLIPYEDHLVDILWVCQYEKTNIEEADGHTMETATSNVQGAIETLLSSRNDRHKEIRFLEGNYTPVVKFDHVDETSDFTNKGFLINTAHQDVRAKIPKDGNKKSYGVLSLSFRGGWSSKANTVEGIQNVSEYPTYISSLNSAWPERFDFHHMFYIEDALQRKSAKGRVTSRTDGTVVPIIFDGLTIVNEYAANEKGSAIYYKEQLQEGQVYAEPAKTSDFTDSPNVKIPKLSIHRCHFLGNGLQKVSHPDVVTSAVTVEKGGGRALIYNTEFHSNQERALKVEDTDILNCTFALNGKSSLMDASSTLHNSVFWKNNETAVPGAYGAQMEMLTPQAGSYEPVNWLDCSDITHNALTDNSMAPLDLGMKNVSLSNNNTDLILGPNFKEPKEDVTSLTDIRTRDFRLLPSIRLLNKGSLDVYSKSMSKYFQAVKVTTSDQNRILTAVAPEVISEELVSDNVMNDLVLGLPVKAYRSDVINQQRVIDNRLDIGAFEYQQPLRRVIYVDPVLPGYGNGSSWISTYPLDKMQDAIDMAAVFAHNNFSLVSNEEDAEAYVFIKGADFHTKKHLTMRAGVQVYGSVYPFLKETAKVDAIPAANSADYTQAIQDFVKVVRDVSPGMAAPATQRTVISSIKASPATAGHRSLMDGFEVKGLPTEGKTYEEIQSPVVDLSVPDATMPTVLVGRNIIVNGFHNTLGTDKLDNSIIRMENGLLYQGLVFNNKVDVPTGANTANFYGIVTVGNESSANGHLVNCTVVGEEGDKRVVNVPGTSADLFIHNSIVYPGKLRENQSRPYGFCPYFDDVEYRKVFNPEPYLSYQLGEKSQDINTGAAYQDFQAKVSKYAGYIDYETDYDLLGNPRVIGPKVDRGCFETWSTKDGDLVLDNKADHYAGWFYPQRGSVVYLSQHAMIAGDDFTTSEIVNPGFLLLQEGGGWYGRKKASISVQYAAIERELGIHNLIALPFEYDYTKGCQKVTYQNTSQLQLSPVKPVRVARYDAAKRAASTYRYLQDNSSCWNTLTDNSPVVAANDGVGMELQHAGTYRFVSFAKIKDEAVYRENSTPKTVQLRQTNSEMMKVSGQPLFTLNENMGWNLVGIPYLVTRYQPYQAAEGTATGYAMDVPHIFYAMEQNGNYRTAGSWVAEEGAHMKAGEGYFMQTAILDVKESLLFDLPEPPTSSAPTQQKRITLTCGEGVDELTVYPSTEVDRLLYTYNVDGVKWMAENEDLPQLYLQNEAGTRFSWVNAAPVATEMKLGVKAQLEGDYTFALADRKDFGEFTHIWLTDREKGIVTDLKEADYTVALKQALDSPERFTLKFGGTAPVLEDARSAVAYQVFIRHGRLIVSGLMGGEQIRVYDVAGRDVLSAEATSREFTAPLSAGVYIVNVNGNVYKVR